MVRYAQHNDTFERTFGSLSVNMALPTVNAIKAPWTFTWTSLVAFTVSSFLCCPVFGMLETVLDVSNGSIVAGHYLTCTAIYFAWLWRQWRHRQLVRETQLQEIIFQCVSRLTPYVEPAANTTVFSLPSLCDVSVPVSTGGRLDLLFSMDKGECTLDVSVGPWDPLGSTSMGAVRKHKVRIVQSALPEGVAPSEGFADVVSKALLDAGVPLLSAEDPEESGLPGLGVVREHRAEGKAVEGARRAILSSRVPTGYRDATGGNRLGNRIYHTGIYWLFTLWPLALIAFNWSEFSNELAGLVGEEMALAAMAVGAWLGGWLVWHPSVLSGHKPVAPDARSIDWDGRWLRETGTGASIDLDRPFSVHLTQEPRAAHGKVVKLGILLSQSTSDASSAARLRFSAAVRPSDALAHIPEMAGQAPIVDEAAFEQWLWPLIEHRAAIHGERLPLSVARETREQAVEIPVTAPSRQG